AQTPRSCSSLAFDDHKLWVREGMFPSTGIFGGGAGPSLGIGFEGSAFEATTPKNGKPTNLLIANDRTDRIHVRVFTRNCGYFSEFDLVPLSLNRLNLPEGYYVVSADVAGQDATEFGLVIQCRVSCYTGTIYHGPGLDKPEEV